MMVNVESLLERRDELLSELCALDWNPNLDFDEVEYAKGIINSELQEIERKLFSRTH